VKLEGIALVAARLLFTNRFRPRRPAPQMREGLWTVALSGGILFLSSQTAAQDSAAVRIAETRDSSAVALFGIRDSADVSIPRNAFQKVENRAFSVGERLVFDIAYGMIKAGTATMGIPDTQRVEDRTCFHVVTTAESSPFFSAFFKVRDRVESFMDVEGIFSWRFEKHIREGRYRSDRFEIYDQTRSLVYYKRDTIPAPPLVRDILCSFYFTRTQPLEVGKDFDVDSFGDGKVYPLRVLVHRKEKIKVPAGAFRCVVVEPVIRGEGIFNQKGKLTIWLTDDERRIPVLMKSKVLVGSIDVRLREIGRFQPHSSR
jgi:hypothetical protein